MDKEDAILIGARAATVLINNGVQTQDQKTRAINYVEDIIGDYKRLYQENLMLKIRLAKLEIPSETH